MNIELLRKKMTEYYAKTTPRQVVREYEKMGVEFENIKPRNLQKRYKMRNQTARRILDETPKEMRNKLFKEALDQAGDAHARMQKYTDDLDIERLQSTEKVIEDIIENAYKLYMPQIKSEITELTNFIFENTSLKFGLPIKVLEIGTKFGGTFFIWNKLNELSTRDREHWSHWNVSDLCISIDFSDGGLHGGISEEEMDKRDLWFQERFDNCHFIRGDSHSSVTSAKLCEILFNKNWNDIDVWTDEYKKLDFIFIDGDHSYSGVQQDFKDYSPFVKKNGIIAFHDIVISDRHHEREVYVGEFWRELIKVRDSDDPCKCMIDGNWYEINTFVEPGNDWAGIGVLIKL